MIVEAAPKAKTVTQDFLITFVLGGRGSSSLYKYKCMHTDIYSIKQHQGTGWSVGALPLFLSHCWNAPWQPFVPQHSLGSQHRGYSSLESTLSPSCGGRECSHAWTGTRPRQVAKACGDTSAGATESRHLAWHCTAWSALQEGFSSVGSLPSPEAVWNHFQCTSLAAWALRKTGGCMQASNSKSSSMTVSKNFLMGSKPSSTCCLYLLD